MSLETKTYIGMCLNNKTIIEQSALLEDDFLDPREKDIFGVMLKISRAGYIPELATVAKEAKVLISDLFEYQHLGEISANFRYYEELILEQSRQKRIRKVMTDLLQDRFISSQEMMDKLTEISESRDRCRVKNNVELIEESFSEIEKRMKNKSNLIGVTSGIRQLDNYLLGFQEGLLYLVGGRPSMGKTMVLVNFLANCNVPAGFISAESRDRELMMRLISNKSRINTEKLILGNVKDTLKLEETKEHMLKTMCFEMFDKAGMEIGTVLDRARFMKRKLDIKILFVDYLQAISLKGNMKKWEKVEEISSKLKQLAVDLGIPVVASAQLRRDAQGKRPELSDFSDSSQLEKDADVAIMIHKHEEEDYLNIEKNRNGRTGDIRVRFDRERMLVTDY